MIIILSISLACFIGVVMGLLYYTLPQLKLIKSELESVKIRLHDAQTVLLQKDAKMMEQERNLQILKEERASNETNIKNANSTITELRQSLMESKDLLNQKQNHIVDLSGLKASMESELANAKQKIHELSMEHKSKQEEFQKIVEATIENLKTQMSLETQKHLEERAHSLQKTGQEVMEKSISPFKEVLIEYQNRLNTFADNSEKNAGSFTEKVDNLNKWISSLQNEARGLRESLKGSKTRGNWGEMAFKGLLENSGLLEYSSYELEVSSTNEEGKQQRPDCVLYIPNGRHIVIDVKTITENYTKYFESQDEKEREKYALQHLESMRKTIEDLGKKKYHEASVKKGTRSIDFVVMFIPVEGAWSLALQADRESKSSVSITELAHKNKIIVATPPTAVAIISAVSTLWREEKQNENAKEIGRLAGLLYNKIGNFTEDFLKIQSGLKTSNKAFEDAAKRLTTGRENIMSITEKIKVKSRVMTYADKNPITKLSQAGYEVEEVTLENNTTTLLEESTLNDSSEMEKISYTDTEGDMQTAQNRPEDNIGDSLNSNAVNELENIENENSLL